MATHVRWAPPAAKASRISECHERTDGEMGRTASPRSLSTMNCTVRLIATDTSPLQPPTDSSAFSADCSAGGAKLSLKIARWNRDLGALLAAPAVIPLKFEIQPITPSHSILRECTDDADSGDATTARDDPGIQQRALAGDGDQSHHARQLARDGPDQAAQRQDRNSDRKPLPL